jgi:glycosyltransferase involved in cell wall biosynthesis
MSHPHLSLIIPAYNEAHRLPSTLDTVLRFLDDEGLDAQIIVVGDGSTDTTAAVIEAIAAQDARVIAELSPRNQGKGAAIARGVRRAAGRYIIFFDADLSYPLEHIFSALEALEGGAQLVIGARDLGE